MKNKKMLGNAMLLITAAIWGIAFVFQRTGMDYVEPFTFGAARMTLAAAVVWLFSIVQTSVQRKKHCFKTPSSQYRKRTLRAGILCGFALMAASTLQQVGLIYTEAGKAGFLTALYIVLVPVFSLIFLKKKMNLTTAFGVALGAVGLYLLSISGGFSVSRGDLLVIGCAVCFTIQILLIDHFAQDTDAIKVSAMEFTVCAIISWILAFIYETPELSGMQAALVGILYCGILSGGCGYTFQMVAQKYTEPTTASLLMSFEAVFAVIGGVLILHEIMSTRELLGCIIMFAAIITVQLPASFGRGKGKK